MKKTLLATHGHFASGIKSSVEIILGEQESIECIDAYTTEESFDSQFKHYLQKIDKENDVVIIVTDLFGGSVNQKIIELTPTTDNFHIITGLNLPLLLELQMLTEESITKEKINLIVESSLSQIRYVNDTVDEEVDDFDF